MKQIKFSICNFVFGSNFIIPLNIHRNVEINNFTNKYPLFYLSYFNFSI